METSHRRNGIEVPPPTVLQERRVQYETCAEIFRAAKSTQNHLPRNCRPTGREGKMAPSHPRARFKTNRRRGHKHTNLRTEAHHQGDTDETDGDNLEIQTDDEDYKQIFEEKER